MLEGLPGGIVIPLEELVKMAGCCPTILRYKDQKTIVSSQIVMLSTELRSHEKCCFLFKNIGFG